MSEERPLPELYEVAPGLYRVKRKEPPLPARSSLPAPTVISDEMPPTEQVDGVFYTSKAAFRAVGRREGLTEVGNEKFKPMVRSTEQRSTKRKRVDTLRKAIAQFRSGRRAR
jgi:hypothetical protein